MELLTIQEVAQMMRVSPVTIRRHIKEGDLSAVRVGRKIRVTKNAAYKLAKPVLEKRNRIKSFPRGKPITFNDSLWKIVGSAMSAKPTDSSKKHEYLAEALLHSGKV